MTWIIDEDNLYMNLMPNGKGIVTHSLLIGGCEYTGNRDRVFSPPELWESKYLHPRTAEYLASTNCQI
jgi:hypothetical protein